jgi:Ca2+-binding EF-hand superfamily protein
MKKALIALLGMGLMISAAQADENDKPQNRNRQGSRGDIIKKYDKNGDGKLDEKERAQARKERESEMLKKYDKNKDGKLDEKERNAAREEFRRNRGGDGNRRNRERPQKN